MTDEERIDILYQAKLDGQTDIEIIQEHSASLKEIEQAIISKTGINLNLFSGIKELLKLHPKEFSLESSTVWSFKSRGKWATHNGNYRGNWSPYIPRNIILRYSDAGNVVLDQFSGGGTTAVEAKLLGRRCIARDINPGAVELTRQNLDFDISLQETLDESGTTFEFYEPDVSIGDASDLSDIEDESVDLICTHPPYADIVNYSEGIENDLSLLKVNDFLDEMTKIASECHRVLKPNGVCAILIGDMRKNKRVIPLGFQTIEKFLGVGFSLKDLIIKRQHNCRTNGFWYSSSIKHNFLLLAQEYLPVFVKTTPAQDNHENSRRELLKTKVTSISIPQAPERTQCKTTWVFENSDWTDEMESNLLNRFGGSGKVVSVDLDLHESINDLDIPDQLDLVYIQSLSDDHKSETFLNSYVDTLENLIPKIHSNTVPNGHLAIRVKDFKENGFVISPALSIWNRPLDTFKIREIIVVTSNEIQDHVSSTELYNNHEFILVYQKD